MSFESLIIPGASNPKWDNEARLIYDKFKPLLDEFIRRTNLFEDLSPLGKYKMFSRIPYVKIKTGSRGVLKGVKNVISSIMEDPKFKDYKKVNSPIFPVEGQDAEFNKVDYPYKNYGIIEKDGSFLFVQVTGSTITFKSLMKGYATDIYIHKASEYEIECLFWDGFQIDAAKFVHNGQIHDERGREYDEPVSIFYEYSNKNGKYEMEADFFGSANTNFDFAEVSNVYKIS